MGKPLVAVVVLALVFGGAGSSALLTRAGAQPKALSAVQHEKRLGPKPTPMWYWHWIHWRLHGRKALRPGAAPRDVPRWAWRRFHFFLVARSTRPSAGGHEGEGRTQRKTRTAPSKSSSGSVLFDGRAKQMTALSRRRSSDPGTQSSSIWSCLCFIKNDIQLASDSTFGRVYNVNVATGDSNGFGGTDPSYGAAQVSVRRSNDLGKWDYFAGAVKVNSWNGPIGDLFFVDLWSLGYQTSANDQVALGLWNGPNDQGPLTFSIASNAGYGNDPNNNPVGTTNYEKAVKNVTFGHWEEFVVGVKWATDKTGEIRVYNRRPGGSWTKLFDKANIDTYVWGTTPNGSFAKDGSNWPTVIDKLGLYFKEYGGESEAVQESGLTRSSDLATAKSTLP